MAWTTTNFLTVCPSHGNALTPDEKEIWLCDAANRRLHVFDLTSSPPKQIHSIEVREEPCWLVISLDGRLVYPSTGEVIDARTKKYLGCIALRARAVQAI